MCQFELFEQALSLESIEKARTEAEEFLCDDPFDQTQGRANDTTISGFWVSSSGGTLRQDNCQLIGQSLIVLARQAQKDRN